MYGLLYASRPWTASLLITGWTRAFSSCSRLRRQTNAHASTHATITTRTGQVVDQAVVDALLRRRMYYTPSFEIYGGFSGFYDLGPPGSALQANLINSWREQFIVREDALEVDCPAVTPEAVLKASGHTEKFTDWICKDLQTGEAFRADHLVKERLGGRLKESKAATNSPKASNQHEDGATSNEDLASEYDKILSTIDELDGPALGELIKKYGIKNPTTGGELSHPVPFNLMFPTHIGPSGSISGFLRPETAQGHFTNFAKLLEYNQKKMPFASASVGKAFRNEISPRSGLLRVREFMLAEIEHFVDPAGDKRHSRFDEIKDVGLELLDRQSQLSGRNSTQQMSAGTAVASGLVNNETLGYYLARIQQFLVRVGIDATKIRFRQHMPNEMAHYATDCWDAEIQSSYGWIECVGCADRSAYDLTRHAAATNTTLSVREAWQEPKQIKEWQIDIDMKQLGQTFKKDAKAIETALSQFSQQSREELYNELARLGKATISVPTVADGQVEVSSELLRIERRSRMEHIREFTPNVIEPSFGIGRILYCIMEHSYWSREGAETRAVMSFPTQIAPIKAVLLPLSNRPDLNLPLHRLQRRLREMMITSHLDNSSVTIGKRYARSDELGTPFGITVDFQSLKDGTFTLRERDTTQQVRADEETICDALKSLTDGTKSWLDISNELPRFSQQEANAVGSTAAKADCTL